MAEITATQAIVIEMLCTVGRERKITTQRAQEIFDKADSNRYKEALELLRAAQARTARVRIASAVSGEREGRVERRD